MSERRRYRLVVLAPNWLGDAVMALPAMADLRRHFPDAALTVAGRRSVAPLFEMVDGIDAVLPLPGRGGLRGAWSWKEDGAALAAGDFEAAVIFPNSFASALAAKHAGIDERWGYAVDLRSHLLTRAVPRPPRGLDQAAYYQALVEGIGVTPGPRHARVRSGGVPVPDAVAGASPYVVLAPGAAYGRAKQWPPHRYAELAAILMRERDVSVVLVGSQGDAAACREIGTVLRQQSGAPSGAPPAAASARLVDLSGRTTLAELAAVMAGARAVVSNDSGAMHLAGAVGAPVVAVFGATDERRTAPLTSGPDAPVPAIVTHEAWCRPCMLRECPIDHRCMTGISARAVADALGPS